MYESREKDTPALESPNDYCALLSAAPFLTLIWLEFKVKSIRIQSIICLLICPVEKKSIQKSQEKKYLNIAIFIKVWSASGRWPKLDAAYTHTHTYTHDRERGWRRSLHDERLLSVPKAQWGANSRAGAIPASCFLHPASFSRSHHKEGEKSVFVCCFTSCALLRADVSAPVELIKSFSWKNIDNIMKSYFALLIILSGKSGRRRQEITTLSHNCPSRNCPFLAL